MCDLQSRRPFLDDGVVALHPNTGSVDKCAELVFVGISDRVSKKNFSASPVYSLSEQLVDVFAEWRQRHNYLHEQHWVGLVSGANAWVALHDFVHFGPGGSLIFVLKVCLWDHVHE
jgi:hypothetical protein